MNTKNFGKLIICLLFYFLGIKSEDNNLIQLKVYFSTNQEPLQVRFQANYPMGGEKSLAFWQAQRDLKGMQDISPINIPLGLVGDFLNPYFEGSLKNIEIKLDTQKVMHDTSNVLIDGKQLRDFIKNNPGKNINIIFRPVNPESLSLSFDKFEIFEPIVASDISIEP